MFELLFKVLILVFFSRFFAECVSALIAFTDPKENYIFSWYGRMLDKWATDLESVGWSSFWLKPLGLCPVCFGVWCGIVGAVFASQWLEIHLFASLVIVCGSVWLWSFEDSAI